jgi:hypothetical protein
VISSSASTMLVPLQTGQPVEMVSLESIQTV